MKINDIINFSFSYEIIKQIEDKIKDNFNEIQSAIEKDNKFFSENYNFSNLLNSINLIKNENWNYKKDNENFIFTSCGNIAVIYDGEPDVAIYMMLKAIKTNNNLVIFEDNENHQSTKVILSIISDILKKNDLKLIINSKVYNKIEEISCYKEFFNKYICIGSKDKYIFLKTQITMPIIYNAYGTMMLYLEDKSNKKDLIEIDSYVYNKNIKLDLYKDNIDESIIKMNKKGHNFMLVIYSNNKDTIKKLVEKVNVKNICINKNPFNKYYNLFFEDLDFIEKKKLYI